MIICYTVPEIWCVTDVIIFHFGPFDPPKNPKNQNLKNEKKKCLEMSSFYISVPKMMMICYTVP